MKVLWFHLMPYPHLPENFREEYSSVWVDIPPALCNQRKLTLMYNDYISEMEVAADAGFDAVCVNEHHSNGYGMMPSPNLVAATLARSTRNAAICIMGNSIALYNPPTRVAEEIAMLDCISGGRVIAGFPVGTSMDACFAYSQNPSTLREKYTEAHDLILRAWKADKAFAWNGRFSQLRYVNPWPKPVQTPHPPIWIPGGGSVETWDFCAQNDYVFCSLTYYGYRAAVQSLHGFWDTISRAGKDRNPYRAGLLQFVGVAETKEEALALYKEPAEYFYGRCLHVDPRFGPPPGYQTEASMRVGLRSQVAAAAANSRSGSSHASRAREIEGIVENGYVILGSPDEVAERLRAISKELHVGNLLLLLHFGNMSKDLTNYNTRLFAEKVLPQLRDVFPEWEHPYWPSGCTDTVGFSEGAVSPRGHL